MPYITPKAEYVDRCIASHLSAYDTYLFESDCKCKEYLLPHHSPAFKFDCCVSHDKDNGMPSTTPAASIVVFAASGRRGLNKRMGCVLANDSFPPVNCHIFLHWQPLNFLIPIIELAQIEQGHTHQWCSEGARVLGWEALTVLTRQSIIPLS